MARVTVEDCIDKVDNRFELVLLAGHRARLISSGSPLTIDRDRDKNPVVALREIADETIAPDDLKEQLIHSLQKYVEVDEPEAETVPLLGNTAAAATTAQRQRRGRPVRPHERGRPAARPRGPRAPEQQRGRRRPRVSARPVDSRKPGSRAGLFCWPAYQGPAWVPCREVFGLRSAAVVQYLYNFVTQLDRPGQGRLRPDDAPVRTRRAGQALQPLGRRGAAQPRLCLCHDGSRQPEARLRRPVLRPSPRSRGDPDRPQARRRDHRRGRPARHGRGYRRRRSRRSTRPSGPRSAPSSTA